MMLPALILGFFAIAGIAWYLTERLPASVTSDPSELLKLFNADAYTYLPGRDGCYLVDRRNGLIRKSFGFEWLNPKLEYISSIDPAYVILPIGLIGSLCFENRPLTLWGYKLLNEGK